MYQTGSEANAKNLLEAFRVFLEANGWTTNKNTSVNAIRRELSVVRGTNFINLAAESQAGSPCYMLCTGSTGFDTALAWDKQPGSKVNPTDVNDRHSTGCSFANGSVNYHFFAHNSGNDIQCVIESPVGFFSYITFGVVDKIGSWTGGNYYAGTRSLDNTYNNRFPSQSLISSNHIYNSNLSLMAGGAVYIDGIDSNTGWAVSGYYYSRPSNTERWIFDEANRDLFIGRWRSLVNTFNQRAILIPITIYINRSNSITWAANINYSPLAYVPNMFYTNCKNIVNGGQLSLGGINYRVFPFFRRADNSFLTAFNNGAVPYDTGWAAIAIKE